MNYHIYSDRAFPDLEHALKNFVESDVDLAAELVFADEEEIRTTNLAQRGIDAVTDVLSFPTLDGIKGKPLFKGEHPFEIDEEGNLFLGSIMICEQRAREQAEEYGHSYERELAYLIVHGVMHLFGYDHMTDEDKAEMREKEEEILTKVGLTR
ncbi:MAG: rRNA maturation RNase YbeY [Clostridia bacterium]|nr:rRNA maturation RNase YbeY [Clostridia bacterium]